MKLNITTKLKDLLKIIIRILFWKLKSKIPKKMKNLDIKVKKKIQI